MNEHDVMEERLFWCFCQHVLCSVDWCWKYNTMITTQQDQHNSLATCDWTSSRLSNIIECLIFSVRCLAFLSVLSPDCLDQMHNPAHNLHIWEIHHLCICWEHKFCLINIRITYIGLPKWLFWGLIYTQVAPELFLSNVMKYCHLLIWFVQT